MIDYEVVQRDETLWFPVWVDMAFYPSERDFDREKLLVRGPDAHPCIITKFSTEMRDIIAREVSEGSHYMALVIEGSILYRGVPDYETCLEYTLSFFEGRRQQQAEEEKTYHLTPEFREHVINYLEAVQVLVSDDSSMEDIIEQRDLYYADDAEIARCIRVLKRVLDSLRP